MSELAFAPLAHFADVVMGQSPGADLCNTEERGLPFLQGCAEFGASHPHSDIYCSPPLRVAKAGSVLISVRAPVGTMNYADQDYCIGRGLGAFKSKSGVLSTVFLKHAVELNAAYLHRRSQGSTFSAVSTDDVKTVPIPVFKPEKQEKIANILSGIDTAIEKTENLIAKYEQIKAGLMHDLFTRGVLPNGQLRPSREQAPELYQETAIGWIPREWSLKPAGLVAQSIVPGRDKPSIDGGGIPWITVSDLRNFYIDKSIENLSVSTKALAVAGGRIIPKGAVILSCVGDFGLASITACDLTMNQQLHAFLPGQEVHPEWLAYSIHRQKRYMERIATQTTIKYLNKASCESIPIPLPSIYEQMILCDKLVGAINVIQQNQSIYLKLHSQKSGLMHDLLTGKVPVKVNEPKVVDG